MSADQEDPATGPGPVTAPRRPPVRQAMVVRSDAGHTFVAHRGWARILACLAAAVEGGTR